MPRIIHPKYSEKRLQDLVDKERALLKKYVSPGSALLDLGCGAGRNTFMLIDELGVLPLRTVFMDYNQNVLQSAFENIQDGEPIEACVGSVTQLPFADSSFGTILSLGSVFSLNPECSIEDSLVEARRVLQPEGVIIFSCFTKEHILREIKIREVEFQDSLNSHNVFHTKHMHKTGVMRCLGPTASVHGVVERLGYDVLEISEVFVDCKTSPGNLLIVARIC